MRKRSGLLFLFFCLLFPMLQGCYSFSGASLPPHLNTVAIPLFDDTSQAGIAGFRESITRSLVSKTETKSRLAIESDPVRADAVLRGRIVSYTDEPSQLGSSTERAVTNRITVVIRAEFTDRVTKTVLFSDSFIGFADYKTGSYTAQQGAIDSAIDVAVDELFNRMISGW